MSFFRQFFKNSKDQLQTSKPILSYTAQRLLTIASWVPMIYLINEHVVSIGKIEGISMKPTFTSKEHVLLWKWNTQKIDHLNYNDVVFLRSPINPETFYIKRIKAKQGDLIKPRYPDVRNKVLVPVNHVWVEGDNVHSIDSNTYGPVSTGLIIGRVEYIIWPLNKFGPVPYGGRECRESLLRYPVGADGNVRSGE